MKLSKALLKTKLKATGVHLSMSAVVFVFLAYLIYYKWYPQPYFSIDGGWQGMRIIAAVDLVLGPLITFLIFDLRKKRREIIQDLMIILVIQFASLAYGIHVTYTQRPLAVIMMTDVMLPASAAEYGDSLQSADDLRRYSSETPAIIYADVPVEVSNLPALEQQLQELDLQLRGRAELKYYRPHAEFVANLRQRQPEALRLLQDSGLETSLANWLEANDKTLDAVMFERFWGRYGRAWLIFDKQGKYLGYFLGLQ